jgi:hypothetical protein
VAEQDDAIRKFQFQRWLEAHPEASPREVFAQAGIVVPTGDLSSRPSQNIEDRTKLGFVNRTLPRDNFANSDLARALGIGDIPAKGYGTQAALGAPVMENSAPTPTFQDYLNRLFHIESGGNPNAQTGSNRGLGQFGPNEERMYGITDANRTDPAAQAAAVAAEHAKNTPILTKALGRDPTFADHYLAHQQGVTGASALFAQPDVPAWQAIRPFYRSDAIAQKAITGNIPSDNPLRKLDVNQISSKGFTDMWADKFNRGLPGGAVASAALPPAFGAGAASPQDLSGAVPSGLLGSMASAVPPGGAAPAPTPPGGAGAVAVVSAPAPSDAAAAAKVTKLLADQKGSEQSATSKGMMALAQQLLSASQAPKVAPMQLAPANTGPLRPLPLTLPKFGQLS